MAPHAIPIGLSDRLSHIDEALATPFPTRSVGNGPHVSGPGFHLSTLALSRDFWEDRSPEIVDAALASVEAERDQVVAALARRWGPAQRLDTATFRDVVDEGEPIPDHFHELSYAVDDPPFWRHRPIDRWLGLAIVQHDSELPFLLYAVVGAESDLDAVSAVSPRG
ncbi:hypothetical protein KIK06_21445 [Nocardiopsis sp. EMB25]|uniref:hypothetical protein n=1 Tax=Nocardiopsis TaxID=2013 RepID=UPI00034CAC2F|nr:MULTISPECIES: hypothetical protein [Nocardiopsis]MCY9786460.1 hypothetical protein [Nocardiopsis sp. EMB25]